jgi:predicted nucleic acid-binding Zn ribbon protein
MIVSEIFSECVAVRLGEGMKRVSKLMVTFVLAIVVILIMVVGSIVKSKRDKKKSEFSLKNN